MEHKRGKLNDTTYFSVEGSHALIFTQVDETNWRAKPVEAPYLDSFTPVEATGDETELVKQLETLALREYFRADVQRLGL